METGKTHKDWLYTSEGDPRGYIQSSTLSELWFHTGTICNLQCPFCLEGSGPGNQRIQTLSFEEAKPFIDEARTLGIEKFSFTGGEPFVNRDLIRMLDYALNFRPCMVLTNGTDPLGKREKECLPFLNKPHSLKFRISLDYPDAQPHDEGRGKGNFMKALDSLVRLWRHGFNVSIARLCDQEETSDDINRQYMKLFKSRGLPPDIPIVSFPDFCPPGSRAKKPEITEDCMTQYHDHKTRKAFMCSYSRFILKINGNVRVYACTLVDDDVRFDLGEHLSNTFPKRIRLAHHRCYSCFALSATCS